MMKKRQILFVCTILLSVSLHSQSYDEFTQAIQANFQEMGQAMANSDPELLATHFTEDALLKFSGKAPLKGRKAIADAHRGMLEQGISVRPHTTETESFGETGYELGTYEMLDQEGRIVDSGTYATIWKKEDGKWLIYRDIISSNP